jgi:alpha-mannosidase
VQVPYRLVADGSKDGNPFNLCAYSFTLDAMKTVRSISLPDNRNVLVFAITLVPSGR